jgi:hypothetical protein
MAQRAAEVGGVRVGERIVRYVAADVPTATTALWRGLEEALREDGAFLK